MIRGLLLGTLLVGTANALSFFVRSKGWGISWQQRVAILTPMTFAMIAVAITLGNMLNTEFDKVLMGIFICWTPQAAIGAIALTSWIMIREYQSISACDDRELRVRA